MFRITTTLLFLSFAGCGGASNMATPLVTTYTLKLRVGQQSIIPEEAVTVLLTKINDSRCPSQVQCIRAGEGIATLVVAQSGYNSASLVVQTPVLTRQPADLVSYRSFQFTLKSLEPSPVTQDQIPIDLYRATVIVEKH